MTNVDTAKLNRLLAEYRQAPPQFHVTSYWSQYEQHILQTMASLDLNEVRSGKYPIVGTFGFNDVLYYAHVNLSIWRKLLSRLVRTVYPHVPASALPYQFNLPRIRELAYRHCELLGLLSNAEPIDAIETSAFGRPQDRFKVNGKTYTMNFLSYYTRYCFAQKHISFQGDEVVVELGPGSGYQIEILKKMYPDLTVLCFDLPGQIYLCETYLSQALGRDNVVGTDETLDWSDLSSIDKGRVHFFGNWQMPLLKDFPFDIFWNAASFGEMEPDIVENYLSYVKGNASWIYLLQARHGKETSGSAHVDTPIRLEDYEALLSGYALLEEHDAWQAHRRMSQSGGYFEGVWRASGSPPEGTSLHQEKRDPVPEADS